MKIGAYKVWIFKPSKGKVFEFQISRWRENHIFALGFWRRVGWPDNYRAIDVSITLFWHEFRMNYSVWRQKNISQKNRQSNKNRYNNTIKTNTTK